jgi:hypothetical protein
MVVLGEAHAVALILGQAAGAQPPAVLALFLEVGGGSAPDLTGRVDVRAGARQHPQAKVVSAAEARYPEIIVTPLERDITT